MRRPPKQQVSTTKARQSLWKFHDVSPHKFSALQICAIFRLEGLHELEREGDWWADLPFRVSKVLSCT